MNEIQTSILTKNAIYYKCPYCNLTHSHGNEKQTIIGNWKTIRSSHCKKKKEEIILLINNFTIRKVF